MILKLHFSSIWLKCPLGHWTKVAPSLIFKKKVFPMSLYTSEISHLFKYHSMQSKTQINTNTVLGFGCCRSFNFSDFLKLMFQLFLNFTCI